MDSYQKYFASMSTQRLAKDLLGRELQYDSKKQGLLSGLIVETEAYLGVNDSASHAYNGRKTSYTKSLYGNPGDLYIYQIRSHYCFDVVVQKLGEPQGILIRALEPIVGLDTMIRNRQMQGVNVTNGPGKLMQALGIQDRQMDGLPMSKSPLQIDINSKTRIPQNIISGVRVGINTKGSTADRKLRFYVARNPFVSKIKKRDVDAEKHGWR